MLPGNERAVVGDGEEIAAVLAPSQLENHAFVALADGGDTGVRGRPHVHLRENSAGGDEQFAVQVENGHAVENAALLAVIGLNAGVGRNVIQHDRVVGGSHGNAQGLVVHVQNANIPDPVNEVVVCVKRRSVAECRINEFAPPEEGKLSLAKNANYIICYAEIREGNRYRNGFHGLWRF